MHLSIIIVNYNVKYFLEQCLYSVIKACKNIKAEIFVVDNHSTDGSREYLEPKFPNVIFKWSEVNLGFGKASNSVLKDVSGDAVLFLNPDTILPEDCFEKCLNFFSRHAGCGALGVRMIDGAGNFLRESKRSFPSASASFFKITGFTRYFPSSALFSRYYAGHLPEDKINEVDVLPGAFLMIHKNALDKITGFDEDFFMYGEDIDLSYRLQKTGFKNYYFPETTIIHFKGESTQRKSKFYIRRFYGAMKLFVNKHYKDKKVTKALMNSAIELNKLLAFTGLFFKRDVDSVIPDGNANTLIVADQTYFSKMIQLVKHARNPLIICGRIAVDNTDTPAATGTIADMHDIILKNKISKIIFCEGKIGFKKIIQITQELKGKAEYMFHGNGTESIVGSNDKNKNGSFISVNS